MTKLLILLCLFTCMSPTKADTDSAVHFGVSYAASTFMWGITRKGFGMPRKDAILFTAFTVLAVGFTKEYLDMLERGDERIDHRDLFYNAVGIGASISTCLVFDF